MNLELNLIDQTKSEDQLIKQVFTAMKSGINSFYILQYYAGKLHNLYPEIDIICPIDFPEGLSNSLLRQHECISAINNGTKSLDLVVNPTRIINKQRSKLKEDIKACVEICSAKNVELRAMLDYRMHPDRYTFITCELLLNLGIETIIPATAQFVDDYHDNLVICGLLKNKFPSLEIIFNGHFLTQEQYNNIEKSKIDSVRLKNFSNLVYN